MYVDFRKNWREGNIGVEFYRLGNPVASVFGSGKDANLLSIFGPYEIQNNEILSQFKHLISQFSDRPEINDIDHTHLHSSVYLDDHYEYNNDVYFDFRKMNVTGIVDYLVGSDPETEGDTVYPAIDDVHQLDQRILPHNTSVFYIKSDTDAKEVQAVFWRYGNLQDVIKYPANVTAWNLTARVNQGLDPSLFVPEEKFPWKERYHKFLGLLLTLTRGQELPEGYLILSGKFTKRTMHSAKLGISYGFTRDFARNDVG
jgi:hypothetical protein